MFNEYTGLVEVSNEYIGRNISFVELEVDLPVFQGVKIFRGEAKRSPEDSENDELAATLAYARAFKAISNRLEKKAAGLLRHQDNVAAARKELRAKKAAERKPATKRK